MKVMFDTNIHISWIRDKKHQEIITDLRTHKYLSAIVLMELWAGAKTKQSARIIEKLENPFSKMNRIVPLSVYQYKNAGQIISDLPVQHKSKIKTADFLNDILISLTALSIGSVLYTENRKDFQLISKYLTGLKVEYVS